MSAPALQQGFQKQNELALNITSGKDKGISYKLIGNLIKIGRAEDNDVILNDVKVSRYHAQIETRDGHFWIVDTGSQAGLTINGQPTSEKMLVLGDQITVGNTAMIYGPAAPIISSAPSLRSIESSLFGSGGLSGSGSKSNKWIIFAAVGIALFFVFKQSGGGKKRAYKIKDDSVVSEEIENISQDNETRQQEILKKGKDTQQYSEAQAFYLRGFREFRENNFTRAIQFFETALTLYPEHPLAKRYLSRSRLKLNESIAAAMERGEKYFQNQKYINAFDEYRTVILLTNDLNNKNAQLAQKRIEAINLILMNNR